jgi:hypothetical protein
MAQTIRDLRAWQAARAFKRALCCLLDQPPLATDLRLSAQLREAAASAQSCISEGFGRFDPADRALISEAVRKQHDDHAREVLSEIGGLLDYLQSPEAKRNAERIRQARFERRKNRGHRSRD